MIKDINRILVQGYLAAVNIVGVDTKEREALKKE